MDIKRDKIDKNGIKDNVAAKKLVKRIKDMNEMKGFLIPHVVQIKFLEGLITVNTRTGSVGWPGCQTPSEDVRNFLDQIVIEWNKHD